MSSENPSNAKLQKDKKPKNETANTLTARSALLDFYSDRATSFASFFLASIFGFVTVLAIIQGINNNVFLISTSLFAYWGFSYAGHYTFEKFRFYAFISEKLQNLGVRDFAKLDEVEFDFPLEGKTSKKMKLEDYYAKGTKLQKRLLGKSFIDWNRSLAYDKEGEPVVTIRLFSILYWGMVFLLGVLVYYPATNKLWCIPVLLLSLGVLFLNDTLREWMEARKEFKRFLRLVFLTVFISLFIIFNCMHACNLPWKTNKV